MPAAPATQAEIRRAVEAARSLGLPVSGFSVAKDGTVTVHTGTSPQTVVPEDTVIKPKPKQWAKR